MKAVEKHVVIISREWHKPEISIDVVGIDPEQGTNGHIAISTKLSDFLHALGAELTEAFVPSEDAQRALTDAAERVLAKLKRETVRVM